MSLNSSTPPPPPPPKKLDKGGSEVPPTLITTVIFKWLVDKDGSEPPEQRKPREVPRSPPKSPTYQLSAEKRAKLFNEDPYADGGELFLASFGYTV